MVSWERMTSASSSSSLALSSSWASVVCVCCLSSCCSVWLALSVTMRVVTHVGCLSTATYKVVLGIAVPIQAMSLGRRSLLVAAHSLVWQQLTRLPISWLIAFASVALCLVSTGGLHFEMSGLQRSSWCGATNLDFFQYILLCLRNHDVICFAVNRSSDSGLAHTLQSAHGSSSSSGSSCGALVMGGVVASVLATSLGSCGLVPLVFSPGSLSGS